MNLPETSAESAALLGLCVALGIGLLVGAERERRKGAGASRGAAGVRTFAISSLLGAVAMLLGGMLMLSVAALVIGALVVAAYRRAPSDDPGMTTEVALVLTCLLGGLAMDSPMLAGGIGSALALLLASRERIHHFIKGVMSERELDDALLFVAAALIMLPIAPDRYMGPYLAINPHAVATLIVLVMAASAIGYIATRAMGARYGLALAGFAGGFISSAATIYSMGGRAAKQPTLRDSATAGAVLSSVATFIQLSLIVLVVQPSLFHSMVYPLVAGGAVAAGYGLILMLRGPDQPQAGLADVTTGVAGETRAEEKHLGRAFDLKQTIMFAGLVSAILFLSAMLHDWLGDRGALLVAAIAGLADAHAIAASTASLQVAGKLTETSAMWLILVGLSSNSLTKAVVAFNSGGVRFALRVVPGLLLMLLAAWGAAWLHR
jgi:uncharacterized membrane protein (DUF4010 family)